MMRLACALGLAISGMGCDSTSETLVPGWTQVPSNTTDALHDIFISGDDGMACGDHGTLLTSGDRGQSWTRVPLPTQANLFAVGSLFGGSPARDDRYVVGDGGAIVVSKDGGVTWKTTHTGTEKLRAIGTFTTAEGRDTFAVAGSDGGDAVVLFSDDELESWHRVVVRKGMTVNDAQFSFSEGWLAGDHGMLLQTSDAGASWSPVDLGALTLDLHKLSGLGPRVVGDGVVIDRSQDQQVVGWSVVASDRIPDLFDEDFDYAVGVGSSGHASLVHLTDLAHTGGLGMLGAVDVEDLGVSTDLYALARTTSGVVVVGAGGAILSRALAP